MTKPRLMIIFGAGASFDSINIYPPGDRTDPRERSRPPLANDLFDDRSVFAAAINEFPRVRYLAHRLRGLPGGIGLEETIERLLSEEDPGGLLAKAIAAFRFYLQKTIWATADAWSAQASGATNYLGLVTDVKRYWRERGPAGFVTFNYERMLEDACADADISYPDVDTYATGRYPLFRPHGAVHWAHPIGGVELSSTRSLEADIIEGIAQVSVSDEFVSVVGPGAGNRNAPLIPALSVPALTKDRFEMPVRHIELLDEWIPRVTHLLIIGWRAADTRFLSMWRRGRADPRFKWIVAGSRAGAEEVNSELAKYGLSPGSVSEHGFGDFLKSEEHRYFFERA